ncbi:MAG: BMP family ABC transporter substrate-binding protein [Thermicanus sp.]|nr:BMP family ABC transporter substrate-binding protein [Thermicanus sp.]
MKRIGRFFLWVGMMLFFFTGCTPFYELRMEKNEPLTVGLLLEGNRFDQGWDSQGYEGLVQIERQLHAKVTYYEFNNHATDEEIVARAEEMIRQGFRLLFGHGKVFENGFNRLGRKYPGVQFILINGQSFAPNVYSICFSGKSMGYFAGIVAGLMTNTNRIGIVAAYRGMPEVEGYIAGVSRVNPKAHVLIGEVGSWGDRAKGREEAVKLLQQGADVLFPAGDAFAIEVINAAREKQAYAVGFIIDQSFIARQTVLVSVTQNVKEIYLELAKAALRGELNRYQGKVYDFYNGGHHLTEFGSMVPASVVKRVEEYLREYRKESELN